VPANKGKTEKASKEKKSSAPKAKDNKGKSEGGGGFMGLKNTEWV